MLDRLLPATAPVSALPAVVCSHVKRGLGVAFVSVTGELDLATAPLLERRLRERHSQARLLVLDLRELSFMDSSGVHVIADANTRARHGGERLVILRGPPHVDRVFSLTGTDVELEIHDLDPAEPPVQVLLQLPGREPIAA